MGVSAGQKAGIGLTDRSDTHGMPQYSWLRSVIAAGQLDAMTPCVSGKRSDRDLPVLSPYSPCSQTWRNELMACCFDLRVLMREPQREPPRPDRTSPVAGWQLEPARWHQARLLREPFPCSGQARRSGHGSARWLRVEGDLTGEVREEGTGVGVVGCVGNGQGPGHEANRPGGPAADSAAAANPAWWAARRGHRGIP
jgi:hypothetical protein